MQWDFTPDQVVRGEIAYDLVDFRKDLAQEIRLNLGHADEGWMQQSYDLIYDLCYWLATGRNLEDYLDALHPGAPLNSDALVAIKEHMAENIAMLGAILQRMIMDGVEAGMLLDDAVTAAAQRHAETVAMHTLLSMQ